MTAALSTAKTAAEPRVCRVRIVPTPLGPLALAAGESAVAALAWSREELARLGIREGGPRAAGGLLDAAEGQLQEYFRGLRTGFDLPFDLRGTAFQRRVWSELRNIPYGATWSYRELAARVGRPAAARAVGAANARNPACIFIPCHRVVRSGGDPGGYSGGAGRKAFLLDLERRGR